MFLQNFWVLGYTVAKASPRNLTWFTRLFLLVRGWGLGTRLKPCWLEGMGHGFLMSKCAPQETTVDREIFVVKIFFWWPKMTKNKCTKILQRQSDEVKIALLGYMKPICGLPDHRRLFFFSHMTNSIRVCLAPCVAYTYLWLSCKLIFGAFTFCQCAQQQKYNSTKI